MITYVKNNEIDRQKWDSLIENSELSYIYGYSWYLDSVCENWDAMILGDYEAVLPLPNQKKMKLSTLFQPFFHHSLEVISTVKLDEKTIEKFYQKAIDKFRISLFRTHFKLNEFNPERWKYQLLEVGDDIDLIRSNYSSNHKRNLKQAQKNKLSIKELSNVPDFIDLFKNEVGDRLNLLDQDYDRLSNLIQTGIAKGKFKLKGVYNEETIVAAGVFILEKNVLTYLKGASNEAGRGCGAMHFLIDSTIAEHFSVIDIFDCGGSNVDSVAEFYKRFGAIDKEYYHYDIVKGKILKSLVNFKRNRSNHGG